MIAYLLNMEPALRSLRFDLRYRIVRMAKNPSFPAALLGPPGYAEVITDREHARVMQYSGNEYPPEIEAARPALASSRA
jgi:hypothetical protein